MSRKPGGVSRAKSGVVSRAKSGAVSRAKSVMSKQSRIKSKMSKMGALSRQSKAQQTVFPMITPVVADESQMQSRAGETDVGSMSRDVIKMKAIKKRRQLIIIAVIILSAIMLTTIIGVCVLMGLYFILSTDAPPGPGVPTATRLWPSDPIPRLTDTCKVNFGTCAYFRQRFVSSCEEMTCDTLRTRVTFKETGQEDEIDFTAEAPPANYKIKAPKWAPCNVSNVLGLCFNKTCDPEMANDPRFKNYVQISSVDGAWRQLDKDKRSEEENCIEGRKETFTTPFSEQDWNRAHRDCDRDPKPDTCVPYTIDLSICAGPLPEYGGKPCYKYTSGTERLPWWNWPLRMYGPCPNCPLSGRGVQCGINPEPYYKCPYVRNPVNKSYFTICCLKKSDDPDAQKWSSQGLCLYGKCFPYAKL